MLELVWLLIVDDFVVIVMLVFVLKEILYVGLDYLYVLFVSIRE